MSPIADAKSCLPCQKSSTPPIRSRKACELTEWKEAEHWDTLAAAYAETGEFAEAVKWQQKALDSPEFFRRDPDREKELEKARTRLKLYQEHKPYRDE